LHCFPETEELKIEQHLINEIARGSTIAFEKLYKKYVNIVYSYLLTRCSDKDDALDILQETFISIWESSGSYQGQSKPVTWIIGIARNKLNDYFRRVYRQGDAVSLEELWDLKDDDQFTGLESRMDTDKLLDALPAWDKELIFMVFNLFPILHRVKPAGKNCHASMI